MGWAAAMVATASRGSDAPSNSALYFCISFPICHSPVTATYTYVSGHGIIEDEGWWRWPVTGGDRVQLWDM